MSNRLSKGLHSSELQPTFDVIDRIKGTTLYNYNQHWIEVEQEGEEQARQNEYNSLRVDYPVTGSTIFDTLIGELYPEKQFKEMLDDYNAAKAGIESEDKEQPYIDYLKVRKSLQAVINADCITNGMPLE